MVIERTRYPCISGAIVYTQTMETAYGTFKIECRAFSNDKSSVIIHEYDLCNRVTVHYYRYCSLFHFVQAVKQIFLNDWDLWLDFANSKFFITEYDNGYTE